MAIDVRSTLERAIAAFTAGDMLGAAKLVESVLAASPSHLDAWLLHGRIAARMSRWDIAERSLDKAASLAPREAEVPFARAMIRMRQGRMDEALEELLRAEALHPNHPEARTARGECLRQLGRAKEALELLGRTPTTASQAVTIVEALVDLGEREAAEAALATALGLDLRNANARQQLMRRAGELREQAGDVAAAFTWYARARDGVVVRFDPEATIREFRTVRETFSKELLVRLAASPAAVPSRRPFLIVGMPRSGTTLLEKMIASHPSGAGAGETTAMLVGVTKLMQTRNGERRWPQFAASLARGELEELGRGYIERTNEFAGADPGRDRPIELVADKFLQNWVFAGLIALALPGATMVHLERDPFDAGLSCFERLVPAAMPWCCRLEHIGVVLAINEWLMRHWHAVLPPSADGAQRLHRVRYEDLARTPRETLEPLLAAAGLPWDDRCIRPNERRHAGLREPPPTLSADQVKRPINDAAVGRAERFGALLEPMRVAYRETRNRLDS